MKKKVDTGNVAIALFTAIMVGFSLWVFAATKDWLALASSYFFLAIGANYFGYVRGVSTMRDAVKNELDKIR